MGGYHILCLLESEVMIEPLFLLSFDHWLEFQITKFIDDIFRGKSVTGCGRESASKFL